MRLAIVTNFPSYHNVDLFNSLALLGGIELKVFYLRRITSGRKWRTLRTIQHKHEFLREVRAGSRFYLSPGLLRKVTDYQPELLIITQYASIGMQFLMYQWTLLARPWVYWGEAPGVKYTENVLVENDSLRSFFRKLALVPFHRGPNQIWAIGEYAKKEYQNISKSTCLNVPYFFKQDSFMDIPFYSHNQDGKSTSFLYCGKQVHRKGFDILVDAIKLLSSDSGNFHLNIMGDAPQQKQLIELHDDRIFSINYLGFKELHEVPEAFATSDVLVFPTRYDGWGMAVVEAMAAGMPVISSDACVSAQDIVVDGYNGFRFESENAYQLAHHMRYFIENPLRIRSMGVNARESVKPYDASEGARVFEELAAALLKS